MRTPRLDGRARRRLEQIDLARRRLGADVARAGPWTGRLRRQARADTVRASTAIEGIVVSGATALAAVTGAPIDGGREARAVAGYALAMQHVAVLATDPSFAWTARLLLDLHFEACASEPAGEPGLLRTGGVLVTGSDGAVAYRPPGPDEVPALFEELVAWLAGGDLRAHPLVRASMAHLHLVSIHPFRDGNGRLSRILQSLVLAREGVLAPELGSIEESLARDTAGYHRALQEVQGGHWSPRREAGPWVTYCLDAHLAQAERRLALLDAAARRWKALEALVEARGWPDRLVIALEAALHEGAERAAYATEAGVSAPTASADLRRLLDAGLVERRGATRNARYVATPTLRAGVLG